MPDDTHYTVEYAIYGDTIQGSKGRRVHWRVVRQCVEIVRTWCDLSDETSDVEQGYYARVRAVGRRASSKWALTRRRLEPKSDTIFGPPLVSIEIENNSATITLKGPMRYMPKNHTLLPSMATLYPQMTYNLSIHNKYRNHMHHIPVAASPYKYGQMEYNTEYCFSAQSRFISMPVECHASPWHCITTPQDPVIEQLKSVVVGIVVPILCICLIGVAGYLLHHYLTGKEQKSPHILKVPSFHPPPVTFPPESINPMPISIIKSMLPADAISDPECPKCQLHVADFPPAYFPQGSEAPSQPEEPLDYSSTAYGFVSVASGNNGERGEEGRGRRHDEGDDEDNMRREHQKCVAGGHYASQGMSPLSQKSTHTLRQTQMPEQTEMSTFAQGHAWLPLRPGFLTQTQASSQSFQGSTTGEVNRKEGDEGLPGLVLSKNPQTGLFLVPLNLQTKKEVGLGEEVGGVMKLRADMTGKIDVEDGCEREHVPLLSAYASQNITNTPTSYFVQAEVLPDDYGIVRVAATQEGEEDHYGDSGGDDDKGTNCINWDPATKRLKGFNKKGGSDEAMLSEAGSEGWVGGQHEEVYVMKGELKLENVIVRQASEEEAGSELDRGGRIEDILTKWNLVISMDE